MKFIPNNIVAHAFDCNLFVNSNAYENINGCFTNNNITEETNNNIQFKSCARHGFSVSIL